MLYSGYLLTKSRTTCEPIKPAPATQATYPELLHLDEEDCAMPYLFTNERFQEIQNELEKGDKEP